MKYYETSGDWYMYRAGYSLGGVDNDLQEFYKIEKEVVEDGSDEVHKYIMFHRTERYVSIYTQCYHVDAATEERTPFVKSFKLLPDEEVALHYKLTELGWIDAETSHALNILELAAAEAQSDGYWSSDINYFCKQLKQKLLNDSVVIRMED